jgi:hypothetical protein
MIGNNMRQVQPETVIFLPVYKISSLKITLPKTLLLKTGFLAADDHNE